MNAFPDLPHLGTNWNHPDLPRHLVNIIEGVTALATAISSEDWPRLAQKWPLSWHQTMEVLQWAGTDNWPMIQKLIADRAKRAERAAQRNN
jgi:hypothetical protein